MQRRKLEYLVKRFCVDDLRELYQMIEAYGIKDFGRFVCEFLRDPSKTDDPFIATEVPEVFNEEALMCFFKRFRAKFSYMNDLCERNNTKPFFPHPDDVTESELIREDLIALRPEEELNEFYGVSSYEEYVTPPWNK